MGTLMPPAPPPATTRRSPRQTADAARRALSLETASTERRRRLTHRLAPALLALAITALALGIVVGSRTSSEERAARDFAAFWQHGNYTAMWQMLTPTAKKRISSTAFANAYRSAAATATATRIEPGKAKKKGSGALVPVHVDTRVFGPVDPVVEIPVVDDHVDWQPSLVFPGLRPGETLTRNTR